MSGVEHRRHVAAAFGTVVREMRDERGLSQEDLAELADFDRTYPSLLERGLRMPSLGAVFRLAEAFGVSAQMLVGNTLARMRGGGTA